MVAFLILAGLGFAGLLIGPGLVVPGIRGMQQGATANADLDINRDRWVFTPVAPSAVEQYVNPSGEGYLEMSAPTPSGDQVLGFWSQAFDVVGSRPYAARVQLDVRVELGDTASRGTLSLYVESSPVLPGGPPVGAKNFTSPSSAWAPTPRFNADARLTAPGTYYLIVAFSTDAPFAGTSTVVGIDNVRVVWSTDAGVVFYIALPVPAAVFISQDPTLFLSYYLFLLFVVLFATAYHAVREWRETGTAFFAPLHALGTRLRARSAWLAVGQVFLAVWFFQIAVILILEAAGALPDSPIQITGDNVWVILYELANASVYEEFAFRVLLIGLPMAIGALILRVVEVNRSGGTWQGSTTPGRHIAGAARYLIGGRVRRTSSKETLLASWALLIASSAIFGLAHLPAWGWWKVFPSLVAGLGFGYLFLRHGVSAAILAHFVTDYAFSLAAIGYGGIAFKLFLGLYSLGLAAAGSGFFLWYLLHAWGHLRELKGRLFGPPPRSVPIVPGPTTPGLAPPPAAPPAGPSPWPTNPPPSVSASRDTAAIPSGYVPSYRPPLYGFPPVRFQCPACGWVEARYDAGHFTCTRCGKAF